MNATRVNPVNEVVFLCASAAGTQPSTYPRLDSPTEPATVGVHNVVTMALFLRLLVPRVTPKIKGALLKLAHAVSTWTAMQSRRIYAMLHTAFYRKVA